MLTQFVMLIVPCGTWKHIVAPWGNLWHGMAVWHLDALCNTLMHLAVDWDTFRQRLGTSRTLRYLVALVGFLWHLVAVWGSCGTLRYILIRWVSLWQGMATWGTLRQLEASWCTLMYLSTPCGILTHVVETWKASCEDLTDTFGNLVAPWCYLWHNAAPFSTLMHLPHHVRGCGILFAALWSTSPPATLSFTHLVPWWGTLWLLELPCGTSKNLEAPSALCSCWRIVWCFEAPWSTSWHHKSKWQRVSPCAIMRHFVEMRWTLTHLVTSCGILAHFSTPWGSLRHLEAPRCPLR